jgi:hypothetical protein
MTFFVKYCIILAAAIPLLAVFALMEEDDAEAFATVIGNWLES